MVDEYTYTQALGPQEATSRLTNHWQTWITEADFAEIAADGLNHVRIPIGYWAVSPLPGDPYVQGQLPFLDQAVGWARAHNIKILLDVHGGLYVMTQLFLATNKIQHLVPKTASTTVGAMAR